jgi:hypothetical protein
MSSAHNAHNVHGCGQILFNANIVYDYGQIDAEFK